ncbi:hypothetical protein BD414DRAFT_472837 [Trametes punicea]|nr:hypothetical protein BD414DRAFT_472837 [Trametes punicea]
MSCSIPQSTWEHTYEIWFMIVLKEAERSSTESLLLRSEHAEDRGYELRKRGRYNGVGLGNVELLWGGHVPDWPIAHVCRRLGRRFKGKFPALVVREVRIERLLSESIVWHAVLTIGIEHVSLTQQIAVREMIEAPSIRNVVQI